MKYRETTGLTGIALWRDGHPIRTDVRDQPLRPGDGILFFGTRESVRSLSPKPDFTWLNPPAKEEAPPELRRLGPYALAIMAAVILVAAMDWLSICRSGPGRGGCHGAARHSHTSKGLQKH